MDMPATPDKSSAFISFAKHKPVDSINNIIDAIRPFGQMIEAAKGEVFRYRSNNQRVCYLLHSGSVTLLRRGDGMVLNSEQAPFILGVTSQLSNEDTLYVRITEDAVLSRLPLERFNLLVESYALWENMCKFLVYNSSRVYEHCASITHMSSYEIIKCQLQELMLEPERVRLSITAANYIRNRTWLSRSGTMRILADLKSAGCIELNRGVLIAIKHLPLKY
jgi:CRP-like cAMP-binding protein